MTAEHARALLEAAPLGPVLASFPKPEGDRTVHRRVHAAGDSTLDFWASYWG